VKHYAEHLDYSFQPPELLKRHVEAGLLGRKLGRGFYDYSM
jgi:3-hydroxyacyl-CoA dehydrogenase